MKSRLKEILGGFFREFESVIKVVFIFNFIEFTLFYYFSFKKRDIHRVFCSKSCSICFFLLTLRPQIINRHRSESDKSYLFAKLFKLLKCHCARILRALCSQIGIVRQSYWLNYIIDFLFRKMC